MMRVLFRSVVLFLGIAVASTGALAQSGWFWQNERFRSTPPSPKCSRAGS
jgi:hypothetical protein